MPNIESPHTSANMSNMSEMQHLHAEYYVKHTVIMLVFSVLATIAVSLRFLARRIQKMSLELNDYLVVLGLLFALGETAVNIYGCCYGMAKGHSQEDTMKAVIFSLKSGFICPIIWVVSVTFIRASIIFLYVRIFPTRLFRNICYVVLGANVCFMVGTILGFCLICQPISYRWDRMAGGTGYCGDQKSLDLSVGIFNLSLDVTAVVLPMPVLWGLKMPVGKKAMLSGMFGMGTAICALTAYRIYDTTTISDTDQQQAYALIALLTALEALLGVTNACLPVLKPIYNKMRGTAPKSGKKSSVSEILKSGTIPIVMRVSQMWTMASGKGRKSSSDEETLTEETSGWYSEKKNGKKNVDGGKEASVATREISPPMKDKVERVMGIKTPEIYVRRDVDVESMVSQDERASISERWERRQERW